MGFALASQFPVELDWASLVLGTIGTVFGIMGLAAFPQVIWGRARIEFEFDNIHVDGNKALRIRVLNPPEVRRFLRRLVWRETLAVDHVWAEIREEPVSRLVVQDMVIKVDGSERFNVPASLVGRNCPIVVWEATDKQVHVFDSAKTVLPPGEYSCDLRVMAGSVARSTARRFRVGTEVDGLFWLTP